MYSPKHPAFYCECGKGVILLNGFEPLEFDESEESEFILECKLLDTNPEASFGFCEYCELTKN